MTNHHPTIDQLSCFAAGSLPMSQALCISAHTEECEQCRRQLQRLELLGAEMFSHAVSDQHIEELQQDLMSRLDELTEDTSIAAQEQEVPWSEAGRLPGCLRSLLPEGLGGVHWKRMSPSIHAARLCSDVNGAKVELIKIKPGGQVARHNHTGEEITLVLQGSFSDAYGVYGKGDIIFRGKQHKNHRPIASQAAECICLTAVEAPIQFTGWFARLFNPLIRRSHYAS